MKEIICDRYLNGVELPKNIKLIAALNPYRKRNENQEVGITIKSEKENLDLLVYRVYPVPDSFAGNTNI
jgi:hypothetical protein